MPYDDLLLESRASKHLVRMRKPSSRTEEDEYKTGSILYGTRMPLNMFLGLYGDQQSSLRDYEASNAGVRSLVNYARSTDKFLSVYLQGIDGFAEVSERTQRRKVKGATELSRTQLKTLVSMHDFLSTACGYGTKKVTLTNSIDQQEFYDQPHFGKKFIRLFGCSPTDVFTKFDGLPEQLLTISYKRMPDFHDIMHKLDTKETRGEL